MTGNDIDLALRTESASTDYSEVSRKSVELSCPQVGAICARM